MAWGGDRVDGNGHGDDADAGEHDQDDIKLPGFRVS